MLGGWAAALTWHSRRRLSVRFNGSFQQAFKVTVKTETGQCYIQTHHEKAEAMWYTLFLISKPKRLENIHYRNKLPINT